jgi:hypothetical protein
MTSDNTYHNVSRCLKDGKFFAINNKACKTGPLFTLIR